MHEKNLLLCLRLIRSPGIGCLTYTALVREHGDEKAALTFLSQKKKDVWSEKSAMAEIKAHKKIGATLITYHDESYPPLLKHIHDFPPVLSVLGRCDALNTPSIGIVGSRNASIHAIKFTQSLSRQLAESGYTIVSGLARGIDGAAHKGALDFCTIAVVAGGVDHIYPPEHGPLREKIIERGAVISEMPFGLFPGATHFPRRNRLISGLCKAVCIMEAAKPSGSLITAGYTLDQGRELFVVPGFPGDARCHGTNHLIKEGAHVLENTDDIINVIGPPCRTFDTNNTVEVVESIASSIPIEEENIQPQAESIAGQSHFVQRVETPTTDAVVDRVLEKILKNLSAYPLSMEELFQNMNERQELIHDAVLNLELQGQIQRDARGYLARVF